MVSKIYPISASADLVGCMEAIKKAFELQGYKNMFSSFVVNSAISVFETKDWGEFLDNKRRVYTSAEITDLNMNNHLGDDIKWVKLIDRIDSKNYKGE